MKWKFDKHFLERMCKGCRKHIMRMKNLTIITFGFLSVCFLMNFYVIEEAPRQDLMPSFFKAEDYPPFEPDLQEDFPTGSEVEPRIPHILHQTYKVNYIPNAYALNIKKFLEYNSDWKYVLWTEQLAWKLIIKRYPSLLGTLKLKMNFKDLCEVLRYVVLYEFGGVYADMSLKWLRPIKKLTYKYTCIFTSLPFEGVSLVYERPYLLNKNQIFCRAKHPFLKQIIDNIPFYQPMVETEDVIGTCFLTSQFIEYTKQYYFMPFKRPIEAVNTSPNFYFSKLTDIHENAVFIPNSKYFYFNLDTLFDMCKDFINLSFIQKRGCVQLQKRRGINKFAFTYTRGERPTFESLLNFLFRFEISTLVGERLQMFRVF